MKAGRFITLEGIEGVGKSSNLDYIRSFLEHRGIDVVVTREPGGTPLAEEIRELVLNTTHALPPQAEMLLLFAARSANLASLIRPALQSGRWVICDRFTEATLAYQGYGRGLDVTDIYTLANLVHGDAWPDLTLLLDAPVEIGLQRAARRSAPDRFEREELAFFERVRQGYLQLAADQERIRIIDASVAMSQVQEQLKQVLTEFIESHRDD